MKYVAPIDHQQMELFNAYVFHHGQGGSGAVAASSGASKKQTVRERLGSV